MQIKSLFLALLSWTMADSIYAQSLSLEMTPKITVTGSPGKYQVQWAQVLDGATNWVALTNLTITSTTVAFYDSTAVNASKRFYRAIVENSGNSNQPPANPDSQHLVWIKPGTFTMGSPSTEQDRFDYEGPQTQVTISQGFWMSKFETTQGAYQALMGTNPSKFIGDANRPVDQVNWNDATNYCAKLTARELLAGRLPAGYVYRLPTEAEWEYACRAGTTTATAYGSSLSSDQANFNGNFPYGGAAKGVYLETTTAVGSYAPNAWGLYDMAGNVYEWCLDWYGAYSGGSVTDPRGPNTVPYRVVRGGSWNYSGSKCRSANRNGLWPDYRFNYMGFRLVLATGQ